MNRLFLIPLLYIFSFTSLQAQYKGMATHSFAQTNNRNMHTNAAGSEKIKQLKTVYVVKNLDLKPEEQTLFWNTYSKYEDELNNLWVKNKENKFDFENKCKQLQKNYTRDFIKILGSEERANKVFVTDAEFRKMLRKELKGRKD